MSHLVQEYAKACGVKIGEPKISPSFYPIPFGKYITIHHGTCPATTYSYWDEVIEILTPIFSKQGIKIVQILEKEDSKIKLADHHVSCTKKQAFSILGGSLVHIGVDSVYCNFAGERGLPLVAIYSHTNPNNTRPWRFNKKKTKLIESYSNRPSYDPNENPRTIDSLKPEDIAKNILDILNLKKKIKFKTLLIGDRCKERCLDVVPIFSCHVCDPRINVRMDIHHDENVLRGILLNNVTQVTLSSAISDEILGMRRISMINYISDSFDDVFVKKIKSLGIHANLLCTSEENLAAQRFRFFEHEVHFHDIKKIVQDNSLKIKSIILNDFKTKSNKRILVGDKEYPSYSEALKSTELFLLDLDWLYLYSSE